MEQEDLLESLAVKKFGNIISPEENIALEKMLASDANARFTFNELQRIWESSKTLRKPLNEAPDIRWRRLQEKMQPESLSAIQRKIPWLRYAAAIAAIVLITVVYFFNNSERVIVATIAGETKTATLPDGTILTLNGASEIEFDPSDWEDERRVYLSGEGFFEVAKTGATFMVESENARITVLGTSFNVQTGDARTMVTCVTGKVSVDNKSRAGQVVLTPGLAATVTGNIVSEVYPVDPGDVVSWMNEDLDFRNTSLLKVFHALEHHYNTAIVAKKEIDSLTFTGNLESGSLTAALKTVCLSAGLTYSVQSDSTIVIE